MKISKNTTMTNRTFTIIKPNAVAAGNTGKMLDMMTTAGFRIIAMRLLYLDRNEVEKFYAVHAGKAFFENLTDFMTSGPVVVAMLEKENAVADLRTLVGKTDPAEAAPGTIRAMYGESLRKNAVHASDSDENARTEAAHFFSESDIITAKYRY